MIKKIIGVFLLIVLNLAQPGQCQEKATPVYKDISFDQKTGEVSYELSVPCWVRIRMGITEGPLYRTICDWEKREVGKHKETWDGRDLSGTHRLVGRKDLVFTFNYFTRGEEFRSDIHTFDFQPPAGDNMGRHLPNLKVNEMHKDHPREFCHEAEIEIKLPKAVSKTNEGFYIIREKTPIEISLADKDRIWFRAERYSLHIFIDDVFVTGELEGYTPYTWIFDPHGINEGKHLVVVNLAGFNDHYGIASLPVYVKKQNQGEEKAIKEKAIKEKAIKEKAIKEKAVTVKSPCPECEE